MRSPERRSAGRWLFVWGPAVALMAAIVTASSVPNLDTEPTGFSDKTLHFWAYGALGALVLRALADASWRRIGPRPAVAAFVITAAWGALDELYQAFVPGRFSSLLDWVADVVGAAAAVGLLLVVARRRGAKREV